MPGCNIGRCNMGRCNRCTTDKCKSFRMVAVCSSKVLRMSSVMSRGSVIKVKNCTLRTNTNLLKLSLCLFVKGFVCMHMT